MKHLRNSLIALALIGGFLAASKGDYEQQVEDNQHYCEMISEGVWFASQQEIVRRCE